MVSYRRAHQPSSLVNMQLHNVCKFCKLSSYICCWGNWRQENWPLKESELTFPSSKWAALFASKASQPPHRSRKPLDNCSKTTTGSSQRLIFLQRTDPRTSAYQSYRSLHISAVSPSLSAIKSENSSKSPTHSATPETHHCHRFVFLYPFNASMFSINSILKTRSFGNDRHLDGEKIFFDGWSKPKQYNSRKEERFQRIF